MVNHRTPLSITALASLVFTLLGCSSSETTVSQNPDADPLDAASRGDAAPEPNTVAFDEEGILIPSKLRSIGTVVPRGFVRKESFSGRSIYVGRVSAKKVVSFFYEYLDCSFVQKVGRGWKFSKATPKAPGDASRTINVVVIEETRKSSRIIITDASLRIGIKAPDGGRKTHEDLYKAAHSGGSPSNPIPGTY